MKNQNNREVVKFNNLAGFLFKMQSTALQPSQDLETSLIEALSGFKIGGPIDKVLHNTTVTEIYVPGIVFSFDGTVPFEGTVALVEYETGRGSEREKYKGKYKPSVKITAAVRIDLDTHIGFSLIDDSCDGSLSEYFDSNKDKIRSILERFGYKVLIQTHPLIKERVAVVEELVKRLEDECANPIVQMAIEEIYGWKDKGWTYKC